MKLFDRSLFLFALGIPALASCAGGSDSDSVSIDTNNALSEFAASKIKEAAPSAKLQAKDSGGTYSIKMSQIDSSLGQEAYRIEVKNKGIEVVGGDKTGLMYGGLDVAEQMELYGIGKISDKTVKPSLKARVGEPWELLRQQIRWRLRPSFL